MIVLKFGGAALADTENFENAISYINKVKDKKPIVVVSAMKGVTDLLIDSIDHALLNDFESVIKNWKEIEKKRNTSILVSVYRNTSDNDSYV